MADKKLFDSSLQDVVYSIDVGAGLRMKHLFVRDPESNIVLITEPY